jgi:hypothetical protein
MKKAVLTLISLLVLGGGAAAQSDASRVQSENEKTVRKFERTWLDAYEQRNADSMNAIVADDFTTTFPDGSMQTKKQIVDSLKSTSATAMKFKTENAQISRLR